MRLSSLVMALALTAARAPSSGAQATPGDTGHLNTAEREIRDLEARWNDAHVRGDTAALFALWADDLSVTVPGMPLMHKPELVAFWRSGRSRILRHDTDSVRIRTWNDSAVVDGVLLRQRDFNGQVVTDHWRFTKVYVRRRGTWEVVAYQASAVTR